MRIALCFLVLAFAGCRAHSTSSVAGPGMNPKREANLIATASKELACPAEGITAAFVESIEKNAHVYRATGCSKTYDSILFCMMGNCSWNETPEKRAAFDLQCDAAELKRTYLGNATFGVAGCGKTITYLYVNGRIIANVTGNQVPAAAP